jgi:hypothetical protein
VKQFSLLVLWAFIAEGATPAGLSGPEKTAISHISANSLRAKVSFLAAESLGGRATPSRGLDVAADFISAQFRLAGLQPASPDGSYFQLANMTRITPDLQGFRITFSYAGQVLEPDLSEVRVRAPQAVDLHESPVTRLPDHGELPPVEGLVVAGSARRFGTDMELRNLKALKPAVIILVGRPGAGESGAVWLADRGEQNIPLLHVTNAALEEALSEGSKEGSKDDSELKISLHVAEPGREDFTARNVAGLLQGSDPVLRNEYVLLTAHYDHLGAMPGANDNASGTASVIELAAALVRLSPHPKRSILFLALYGEEEGLLGAYFYTRHPLVPLRATVANINLEQLGRTDDQDGRQTGSFAFTGPGYSNLPAVLSDGARMEGVRTYAKRNAGAYFDRSDNYAFALAGVVAHTIVVAFEYPDYHAAGDEWQKLDYDNMAKVDKGIAAGLLQVANADKRPRWSESVEAAPFREALR